MAVEAVVTELTVLKLGSPFGKPGRNSEIGKRKGDNAFRETVQNIRPSGIFIREPLKIEGRNGAAALLGCIQLYNVCKFVCNYIPEPGVRSAKLDVDRRKVDLNLVVIEVGGAVGIVCTVTKHNAGSARRLMIVGLNVVGIVGGGAIGIVGTVTKHHAGSARRLMIVKMGDRCINSVCNG